MFSVQKNNYDDSFTCKAVNSQFIEIMLQLDLTNFINSLDVVLITPIIFEKYCCKNVLGLILK